MQTLISDERWPILKRPALTVGLIAPPVKPIQYVGFDEPTGYGKAAQSLVTALRSIGQDVLWRGVQTGRTAFSHQAIDSLHEDYDSVIFHVVPEYYPRWLARERALRQSNSRACWGYTAWETDRIPKHWPKFLNDMDGIFVPCQWNRTVLRQCGVTTRIEVLPHVAQFHGQISADGPSHHVEQLLASLADRFVFYSIGVWSDRKAPWLILEAFLTEFDVDEPVALILKTGKEDWTRESRTWRRCWRRSPGDSVRAFDEISKRLPAGPPVVHDVLSWEDNDIAWLHERGDCFVSLSCGEGWGMGAYEAAWWGKPVIATGYGGSLDYLPDHCSYHAKYRLVPVRFATGGASYTSEQNWAQADVSDARRLMRQVFADQTTARLKGGKLREHMNRFFHPDLIASHCITSLQAENLIPSSEGS